MVNKSKHVEDLEIRLCSLEDNVMYPYPFSLPYALIVQKGRKVLEQTVKAIQVRQQK